MNLCMYKVRLNYTYRTLNGSILREWGGACTPGVYQGFWGIGPQDQIGKI